MLVYAHDTDASEKHQIANQLVTTIWDQGPYPFISPQVLKEFCSVLLGKGYDRANAWEIVEPYLWWKVVPEDGALIREASSIQVRYQLSVWDACIIAAAKCCGATVLCTEDLNHNQDYDGLTVENLFKDP